MKGDYLHYELQNALLDTVDTQFAGAEGVKEVQCKTAETLKEMCAPEERRTVQRLLAELAKPDGLATYGLESVLEALRKGAAEIAIAADNTDVVEAVMVCKRCGTPKTAVVDKKIQSLRELASQPCKQCGSVNFEVEEKEVIDVLEDAASQTNARVEVISTASEEKQKLTSLGGFAAILRFRLPG